MADHLLDVEKFKNQYVEFKDVSDDQLLTYWENATCYLADYDNSLVSGKCLQLMLELLTAHLAKSFLIVQSGGTVGAVSSASEGGVSVSLVPPPVKNAFQFWLASTPYGVQLWAMIRIRLGAGFYVGGSNTRAGFRNDHGHFGC